MSQDRICTFNVSVVRINGNIILVGGPTVISYDGMRFGARACGSSHAKVVFWHVLERFDLQVSCSRYKLVT